MPGTVQRILWQACRSQRVVLACGRLARRAHAVAPAVSIAAHHLAAASAEPTPGSPMTPIPRPQPARCREVAAPLAGLRAVPEQARA